MKFIVMKKSLLIILLLVIIWSCKQKSNDEYAINKPYRKDSAALAPSVLAKADTIQTPEVVFDPSSLRPASADDKYFIVIASFSVEKYALAMKDELEQKGFSPVIVEINNDGWNKLAISSYKSFSEAEKALTRIRQAKGRFADARLVVK